MTDTPNNVVPLLADQSKDTGPTVRAIARKDGIDLATLIAILEWRRPADSEAEKVFVETYLDVIPGMQEDGFGNRVYQIGDNPKVLWSCHTDTVSNEGGKQNLKWDGNELKVNQPKQGQTLGADDGAGMWLMLEMIKAERPGLYVFHREEEVGCRGSRWIANNNTDMLDGIDMAIAFDRKATHSVITRQRGDRCCSDAFALDLADMLNKVDGLNYKLDPTGVVTDTAQYTDDIAECTNLSVGYYDEHTSRERLDVAHLFRLREALLQLDVDKLTIKRKPGENDRPSYSYGSYRYGGGSHSYRSAYSPTDPVACLMKVVQDRPWSVAKMLHGMGMDDFILGEMLDNLLSRNTPAKPQAPVVTKPSEDPDRDEWLEGLRARFQDDSDLAGEEADDEAPLELEEELEEVEMLFCFDCGDYCEPDFVYARNGDQCNSCGSVNTEAAIVSVNDAGEVVEA